MMYMLNHGAQYVTCAPDIQRIINFKTEMEFGYDGKHGIYQPCNVRAPIIPPPPPAATVVGPCIAAHGPPPILLLLPMHILLLLVGMHLQLLLSPPELPLIRARSRTFLSKASKPSSLCAAPTIPLSASLISR
jgi:hypothetical protein